MLPGHDDNDCEPAWQHQDDIVWISSNIFI